MTDTTAPQQSGPSHQAHAARPRQGASGRQDSSPAPGRAPVVIAVDGPAGSGKSSAARGVAIALGLRYLDTGAMYRALTWWLRNAGVEIASDCAVIRELGRPVIEVGTEPRAPGIRVDGADVSALIRTREVSNAVSAVASIPQVRACLIGRQRDVIAATVAAGSGIVAEGRDIGTVVAPDAPVKIFLTASEEARARRRAADLAADPAATPALTRREQALRDRRDAPQLARAADAVEIDATTLALDEVVAAIVAVARERWHAPEAGRVAGARAAWAS